MQPQYQIYSDPAWAFLMACLLIGLALSVLVCGAWELIRRLTGPRRHSRLGGGHR